MKRLALLSLAALFCLAVSLHADDKPKLTAEEILNKHLEAIGGHAALDKIKSRVAIGTLKKETDPDAKMAIMSEAPNRLAAVIVFPQYDWRMVYDGAKPFFQPAMGRDFSVVEDKYRLAIASGLMFNGISLYNALLDEASADRKLETKGTKKVGGRQAYVIEFRRDKKAPPMKLYFDAETFMWVRTDYGQVVVPFRNSTAATASNNPTSFADQSPTMDLYIETSDFKEVDGIKLPFQFTLAASAPLLRQKQVGVVTGTITEYKHNVTIDPKMFQ